VLACSTSMVAVFEAAGMLREDMALALCGGTESMSRVQIGLRQGFSDWLRRFNQSRTFGERIDRLGGATLRTRPALGRADAPVIAWRAMTMRAVPGAVAAGTPSPGADAP